MAAAPTDQEMALPAAIAEDPRGKVRSGSPALDWRAFHDANHDLIWRLLVRFGAPPGEIEDLTQEVFVVVHRKLPSFRGQARLSTWLFSICRRVAAGARRRDRFRRLALQLLGLEPPRQTTPALGAHRDLERLLSRVSEIKRVTFLLHEVDGMSPAEIAALVGCPEATVWSRLRQTWKDLERSAAGEGT